MLLKFIILAAIIFMMMSIPFRDPAPYSSKFLDALELIAVGAASCALAFFIIALLEVIKFV